MTLFIILVNRNHNITYNSYITWKALTTLTNGLMMFLSKLLLVNLVQFFDALCHVFFANLIHIY